MDRCCRAKVTNAKLTEFNMSSTDMKMMSALRRTSTPTAPMVKSTALRTR